MAPGHPGPPSGSAGAVDRDTARPGAAGAVRLSGRVLCV